MAVGYVEIQGSPVETWTLEGFQATRTLMCDWADRKTLVGELAGLTYPLIANTGSIALQLGSVPFEAENKGAGSVAAYEKALVTVEYGPSEGTVYSESLEPTAEFLTEDYNRFQWGPNVGGDPSTPLEENEAPGRLIRGFDYVLTRHNLVIVPTAVIDLIGHVNSATVTPLMGIFASGGWGIPSISFAAETLLFQPPTITRTTTIAGVEGATCVYRLTYKPNWEAGVALGWNYFWRAETQKYEAIYQKDSVFQAELYPTGNFGVL